MPPRPLRTWQARWVPCRYRPQEAFTDPGSLYMKCWFSMYSTTTRTGSSLVELSARSSTWRSATRWAGPRSPRVAARAPASARSPDRRRRALPVLRGLGVRRLLGMLGVEPAHVLHRLGHELVRLLAGPATAEPASPRPDGVVVRL